VLESVNDAPSKEKAVRLLFPEGERKTRGVSMKLVLEKMFTGVAVPAHA
jgi:hypothetical protein